MNKKTKTLLAIGDTKDYDTFNKLVKEKRFFYNSNIAFKHASYKDLLDNNLPKINTNKIILFLFFPFDYWDAHIEPKNYKGVYANNIFYKKFDKFWEKADKILKTFYKDKKLEYINEPSYFARDRNKKIATRTVKKFGVHVPKEHRTRDFNSIIKMLDEGKQLFIKVSYGSMGKGMTYLEKDFWLTNFRFRKNRIWSKKSDKGWSFIEVTNNKKFLKDLLKQNILIEDAVHPLFIHGRKLDLRIYVYKNKVLFDYCRTNTIDNVTTNISQGGRGESKSFDKCLPQKQLAFAKKSAIQATKALGLKFAGVDMMLSHNKKDALFLELNTFPGFPKVRRFNLSRFLIEEIIKDYR